MGRARVAVAPRATDELTGAVVAGGGELVDATDADAIVWTDPAHPEALTELLTTSSATWIQLPFAGIEKFVAAGTIDDAHTWTCAKGIYGPSTAEHALALLLAAARRLNVHIRSATWLGRPGRGAPERRLGASTVAIVGGGGIGSSLIEMLRPLRTEVIVVNRSGDPVPGAARTVKVDSLVEVLGLADFVAIAAAATPETHRMFNATRFEAMKDDAWLINVARGSLVDTNGLVDALRAGTIGGAALDVTDPEPLPDGHPLFELANAIITPHVANTWDMALPVLAGLVERNVAAFGRGDPLEGLVDPALGY
ncbi:MAG: hydroxyacid dehydrogenase [Actinobacteria bacterium]|nr:hydroxyacid dehydrogenase [Actinomycetota bacterium]